MKDLVKQQYQAFVNKEYLSSSLKKEYLLKREVSEHFINRLTIEIKNAQKSKPHLDIKKKTIEQLVDDFSRNYCRTIIGNREKSIRSEEGKQVEKLQQEYFNQHISVAKIEEDLKDMGVETVERIA